jgi:hypothetical protein
METYYLNTLIFFFKTQQEMQYQAIEQVLRIIDNDKIPEARKRKALFQVLRHYGLNETDYKGGKFDFGNEIPVVNTPSETDDFITIPTQVIELRILNGVLQIALPQN